MKLIVNDANILIDLIELDLLPQFFALEFEFFTTSLILEELLDEQREQLDQYLLLGMLVAEDMTSSDLEVIKIIEKSKPKLSQQDCSAYHQAYSKQGTLVTSDNVLRKFAKETNLDVHGHLWVFDQMVARQTLTPSDVSEKLKYLCDVVNRQLKLPQVECDIRYELWSIK